MIVALVQARLNSTRLPRKVLWTIKEKPLIAYMHERLKRSLKLDRIIYVTPRHDRHEIQDAIPDAEVWGVSCPENDVWQRLMTARQVLIDSGNAPTAIVRLCADSPLIDPDLVDYMVSHYEGKITTNTQPRTWPAGQCIEILPSAGLSTFEAMSDEDKEHVTPWYYRNCNFVNVTCVRGDFSQHRMVVDTQEDFDRIKETIEKMDRPHWAYTWHDIVELMA